MVGDVLVLPDTILPSVVCQRYVAVPPVLLPFRLRLVVAQVSVAEAPASTVGGVTSSSTVTLLLRVQPLVLFVTIKMYTPAAATVGVRVLGSALIKPPLMACQL